MPKNFKLIAAPRAVPGNGNLGGDIRKVSVWANIVISIDITVCISLANDDSSGLCKKLCTHVVFMHFTYHRRIQVPKKGRHCWPPTFSTLTPPMDDKYYCNRLITFHCHSSRKFCIHLASIAVASSDLFCIFAPPYSITCIRLWFLNFPMWRTYVNNLSILYRMPLVGSKSVHKRAGNTGCPRSF